MSNQPAPWKYDYNPENEEQAVLIDVTGSQVFLNKENAAFIARLTTLVYRIANLQTTEEATVCEGDDMLGLFNRLVIESRKLYPTVQL